MRSYICILLILFLCSTMAGAEEGGGQPLTMEPPAESSRTLALQPQVSRPEQDTEGVNPFAFAISGGISLGSYEAGVNWALVKYHKILEDAASRGANYLPPRLMAVTGASAGGINALMTGISWCVHPDKAARKGFEDTVASNLFKDIWLGVGFDTLLPEKAKGGKVAGTYFDDDGVLTRKAFKDVLDRLQREMKSDIFKSGCSVPIGLMVTRTKPLEVPVAGVAIENERFIIPLRLTVDGNGRARFKSQMVNTEVAGLGNVIYLAGTDERDQDGIPYLAPESVIDAVLASSAFPVAFGRKSLNYCLDQRGEDHRPKSDKDRLCPPGYSYDTADFVDGGVFDNIPLGAAKALAEPHQYDQQTRGDWLKAGRRFSYIYIDPDSRRGEARKRARAQEKEAEQAEKTYGLRSQLGFLSGAITTGRTYELYKTMSNGDWSYEAPSFVRDHVIPAINDEVQAKEGPKPGRQEAPHGTCNDLYGAIQNDPAKDLTSDDLLLGRRCLLIEALRLGNSYLFITPPGEPLRGNEEVARRRSALIEHARLLMRKKQPQLDLMLQRMAQDKLGDRRVVLSSRYFPITGNYLAAFGAFIDKPLREFDYYAGVYDAVHNIAEFGCENPTSELEFKERKILRDREQKEICIADRAKKIYENLRLHNDSSADTVFHFLAQKEPTGGGKWTWLSNYPEKEKKTNLLEIGNSLEKTESAAPKEGTAGGKKDSEFKIFINNLAESKFDPSKSSNDMQRILELHEKDESLWYYPLSSRATERLLVLEDEEAKAKNDGLVKNVLAVGALALNTYIHEDRRLMGSPSSAPLHKWQNFLPYEVDFGVKNGGFDLAWEPRLRLVDGVYLSLKTTPIGLTRYGSDWIPFGQGDLYLMGNQQNNFFSAGIGPTVNGTYERWPGHQRVNFGAAVFAGLFNKVRLTVGWRNFEDDSLRNNLTVTLGITDVPGIAYWFSR